MDECELRGRVLRFYHLGKLFRVLRIDANTRAHKADSRDSEITLPYNSFQILVGGSPVYLAAQSKDEMKAWINKLNFASQSEWF